MFITLNKWLICEIGFVMLYSCSTTNVGWTSVFRGHYFISSPSCKLSNQWLVEMQCSVSGCCGWQSHTFPLQQCREAAVCLLSLSLSDVVILTSHASFHVYLPVKTGSTIYHQDHKPHSWELCSMAHEDGFTMKRKHGSGIFFVWGCHKHTHYHKTLPVSHFQFTQGWMLCDCWNETQEVYMWIVLLHWALWPLSVSGPFLQLWLAPGPWCCYLKTCCCSISVVAAAVVLNLPLWLALDFTGEDDLLENVLWYFCISQKKSVAWLKCYICADCKRF